jgi:hypothetical protein
MLVIRPFFCWMQVQLFMLVQLHMKICDSLGCLSHGYEGCKIERSQYHFIT